MRNITNGAITEYSGYPKSQKFPMGSFVRITKDLGSHRRHFVHDTFARVQYTHGYVYGGDPQSYALTAKRRDGSWTFSSWYDESELSLITDESLLVKLEKESNGDRCSVCGRWKIDGNCGCVA